ncbi:MAG: hypothetical protein ACOZE7_02525 [Pseudomonadota bacterium]|jgi:hypothetical protein|uniref:hypothetical protein n=1 Tax=Aquabacterium sp. TaxID=1872578 RepID=UPI003BB124BA
MATHYTILFFEDPPRPPSGQPTLALALVQARQALAHACPYSRAQVIASDGRLWNMEVDDHGVVVDDPADDFGP